MPLRLVFFALVFGLSACQGRAPSGSQTSASDSLGQVPVQSGAPAADTAGASDASGADDQVASTEAEQARSALALSGEGLQIVDRQTGATRALEFGMDEDLIIGALAAVQGQPRDRSSNPECGAGPLAFAAWENGLTAWFQEGRFAGWGVHLPHGEPTPEAMQRLTTLAGVGIGSTRREVESVYEVRVMQSSLGTEFEAGGLHGLLTSESEDGEVSNLWAGTVCIFR